MPYSKLDAHDLAGACPIRSSPLKLVQYQSRLDTQIARQVARNRCAFQLVGNLLHCGQQELESIHAAVGAAHVELGARTIREQWK